MTKTRDELEKIIADAQEELKRLDEKLVIFDGWRPKEGDDYFFPTLEYVNKYGKYNFNNDHIDKEILRSNFVFQTHKQAAAVADAICVMLELRNQPGAFDVDCKNGYGWIFYIAKDNDFGYDCWNETKIAFVCPCFPSKHECHQAVDAVGRERVERALKLWAGVAL